MPSQAKPAMPLELEAAMRSQVEPAMPLELGACPLCTPTWTCGLHCLGDRGEVSAEIHARMLELRRQGAIPCSTLEQRKRNALTSSSMYGVPPALGETLKYGYLSPNLAPPVGFVWRCRGGRWALAPQGG